MMLCPACRDVIVEKTGNSIRFIYPIRFLEDNGGQLGYYHYFDEYEKVLPLLIENPHPYLVRLLDFDIYGDNIALEYEFLNDYLPLQFFLRNFVRMRGLSANDERNLAKLLMENFLDWKKHINEIEGQIQSVVGHLLGLGLVHPDLAPNNIVWNCNRRKCKVIDLKTVKRRRRHEAVDWSISPSFSQTVLDSQFKIKKGFLGSKDTPWR